MLGRRQKLEALDDAASLLVPTKLVVVGLLLLFFLLFIGGRRGAVEAALLAAAKSETTEGCALSDCCARLDVKLPTLRPAFAGGPVPPASLLQPRGKRLPEVWGNPVWRQTGGQHPAVAPPPSVYGSVSSGRRFGLVGLTTRSRTGVPPPTPAPLSLLSQLPLVCGGGAHRGWPR